MADSLDLVDAGTFFGFVANTASELTAVEARNLLGFGLDRFERHMDIPKYADGPFQTWLTPPESVPAALAGVVWAAMGSPFSETRWEAAHCVRRWAEFGCESEIDALVEWARHENAGAFASQKLPFYSLHAKLYLQLAFARIVQDQPQSLQRNAAWLEEVALDGRPHWLIQKTAAETALAIEDAVPASYPAATVARLRQVGHSAHPPLRHTGSDHPNVDSPRHAAGLVDKSLKLHFGIDFGDCWLRPLGNAFGVSQCQVEELAREVLVNELGAPSTDYVPDPRENQWNSRDRGAWFHKSSYPHIDDYRFYLWYHGMMSVAPRLLSALPVIIHDHGTWSENEWENWTSQHSLTRNDGRWLSDRRDADPLIRRPWVTSAHSSNWLWDVGPDDFLAVIHRECPLKEGFCVEGHWTDCSDGRKETIWVESTLVDPRTSHALANSLRLSDGPRFYRFPNYKSTDEWASGQSPFDMVGWISTRNGDDRRIDSFDPYAKTIAYPPLDIGATFTTRLGLASDHEKRIWRKNPSSEIVALGEIWSDRDENDSSRRDSPFRAGRRLSIKLTALRELCTASQRDLVISVAIDREWRTGHDEKLPDIPSSHKVFVFSADGRLADATKSHNFG